MIVFYTNTAPTIQLKQEVACNSVCSSSCIKPKNKCCNKYKKKGINCKRCPHVLLAKAS
ncbi:hypothetical protein [Polaribacter marinaquae]|uniref:Uncharacterized protein n=1 Tax=Polaribacter marinaquae TaxID=1642819 RepID=A0ABZ2TP78_9FLAO